MLITVFSESSATSDWTAEAVPLCHSAVLRKITITDFRTSYNHSNQDGA